MLVNAEERRLGLDINIALCLIRQLVPAVAMLHESAPDTAHGAIGPERLVVTPDARLVIVEYVLGAALEQLHYSQERYWHQLRIPLPRAAGLPRFDQRADVTQIGVVALSLILGRQLRDDEYPSRIGDVVASTWAVSARGGFEPLPPGLRAWLGRALQLDARNAFESAIDAQVELDKVLGEGDYLASSAGLESFLTRYHAAGAVSEAPEAPPRLAAPVRPAMPSTPAVSVRPTPAAAWEPTSLEILAHPPAPRTQSPPLAWGAQPTRPAEFELQPLADSVTVRTPRAGHPHGPVAQAGTGGASAGRVVVINRSICGRDHDASAVAEAGRHRGDPDRDRRGWQRRGAAISRRSVEGKRDRHARHRHESSGSAGYC